MHKNTLLLASLLAVIASLLVGFNVGRSMSQSTQPQPSPTPATSPTPTLAYLLGTTCGLSYQYPNTLTAMESSSSGIILANVANPEASIVMVCQQEVPRVPLAPNLMEPMVIRAATGSASASAVIYHDASAKDGSPLDKLIFTHPKSGLDVFIAGYGATYTQFINSLKLQ